VIASRQEHADRFAPAALPTERSPLVVDQGEFRLPGLDVYLRDDTDRQSGSYHWPMMVTLGGHQTWSGSSFPDIRPILEMGKPEAYSFFAAVARDDRLSERIREGARAQIVEVLTRPIPVGESAALLIPHLTRFAEAAEVPLERVRIQLADGRVLALPR
jgi:hypothetical protein